MTSLCVYVTDVRSRGSEGSARTIRSRVRRTAVFTNLSNTYYELEALGQCTPPPRDVLSVSGYGFGFGSVIRIAIKI